MFLILIVNAMNFFSELRMKVEEKETKTNETKQRKSTMLTRSEIKHKKWTEINCKLSSGSHTHD